MTKSKILLPTPKPTTRRLWLMWALAKLILGHIAIPAEDLEARRIAAPPQLPTQRFSHCVLRLLHLRSCQVGTIHMIDGQEGAFGLAATDTLPSICCQDFIPQLVQRFSTRLRIGSATGIAVATLGLRPAAHALSKALVGRTTALRPGTIMRTTFATARTREVFS